MSKFPLPMQHPHFLEYTEEDEWDYYGEAFQSWRAWRVLERDGVLVLQSVTYNCLWVPGQELIARCMPNAKRRISCSFCPDLNHGCGIYSVKDPEDAIVWGKQRLASDTVVYGRVSIWGHCFKFTGGYLSEFAYPSFLFVPSNKEVLSGYPKNVQANSEEIATELNKTYRVEAVTVE